MAQTLISEDAVLAVLKQRAAEVLRLDQNTVTPESSLIKDLGAESLDFLDINYGIEQAFGIKMPRHFVLEHAEEMFGEGSVLDTNSQLTAKGVALLSLRFNNEQGVLKPGMDLDEIPPLLTVRLLAKGVLEILNTLPDACPHCGQAAWTCNAATQILCQKCGERAVFTPGDDVIKAWLQRSQADHHLFT